MIKKILVGLFIISMILMIGMSGYLMFEYEHPYLCEYYYTKDGHNGISHECSSSDDSKYCRKDITKVIQVDTWKYKCGRR